MRRITLLPQAVRARAPWRCSSALAAALLSISAAAGAQPTRDGLGGLRPEVRVDYLGSPDAVHAGAGVAARISTYLRLSGIIGGGPHLSGGGERFGYRADLVGRFQLDPYRQRRWAPYGAAGISLRASGSDVEEYLVLLVGLEGPLAGSWTPALEGGFGGGARVGLVLRRGGPRYR